MCFGKIFIQQIGQIYVSFLVLGEAELSPCNQIKRLKRIRGGLDSPGPSGPCEAFSDPILCDAVDYLGGLSQL